MVKLLGVAALMMSLVGVAAAGPSITVCRTVTGKPTACPHRAPELDLSSAAAGFTLLLGGLAVLRGRRTINK